MVTFIRCAGRRRVRGEMVPAWPRGIARRSEEQCSIGFQPVSFAPLSDASRTREELMRRANDVIAGIRFDSGALRDLPVELDLDPLVAQVTGSSVDCEHALSEVFDGM